jgi:hypothetical protein
VDGALGRLQTAGRDVVTATGGLSKIGTLVSGDTLFILGHGTTKTLGDYSAAALAKLLTDNDLVSGVNLQLVACNSGTGNLPFALELKTELVSRKCVPASVAGGCSYMQVKNDGSLSIANYDWGKKQWSGEITDSSTTVMTPWGPRKQNAQRQFKTS